MLKRYLTDEEVIEGLRARGYEVPLFVVKTWGREHRSKLLFWFDHVSTHLGRLSPRIPDFVRAFDTDVIRRESWLREAMKP